MGAAAIPRATIQHCEEAQHPTGNLGVETLCRTLKSRHAEAAQQHFRRGLQGSKHQANERPPQHDARAEEQEAPRFWEEIDEADVGHGTHVKDGLFSIRVDGGAFVAQDPMCASVHCK